jgi:hypothetical protein
MRRVLRIWLIWGSPLVRCSPLIYLPLSDKSSLVDTTCLSDQLRGGIEALESKVGTRIDTQRDATSRLMNPKVSSIGGQTRVTEQDKDLRRHRQLALRAVKRAERESVSRAQRAMHPPKKDATAPIGSYSLKQRRKLMEALAAGKELDLDDLHVLGAISLHNHGISQRSR